MPYRRPNFVRGVLCFAVASIGLIPLAARAGELEVTATHVVPGPGSIRFILYRGSAGFRHEDQAFRVLKAPAGTSATSVRFHDVPLGQYAVMAYHDSNDDQKLDLRFGMFPKEGWGLSNNPEVIGPPSFSASSFTMTEQTMATMIDMHY